MLRLFKCLPGPAFVLLFCLATLVSAQSPQPAQTTPTPSQSPNSIATLHTGTQLVVVDVVVTEHGAAHLRGSSIGERARRLATIAAPEFREQLEKEMTTL